MLRDWHRTREQRLSVAAEKQRTRFEQLMERADQLKSRERERAKNICY